MNIKDQQSNYGQPDDFIAKNGSFVPVDDVLAQGWEID